jgi:hypothetical protein
MPNIKRRKVNPLPNVNRLAESVYDLRYLYNHVTGVIKFIVYIKMTYDLVLDSASERDEFINLAHKNRIPFVYFANFVAYMVDNGVAHDDLRLNPNTITNYFRSVLYWVSLSGLLKLEPCTNFQISFFTDTILCQMEKDRIDPAKARPFQAFHLAGKDFLTKSILLFWFFSGLRSASVHFITPTQIKRIRYQGERFYACFVCENKIHNMKGWWILIGCNCHRCGDQWIDDSCLVHSRELASLEVVFPITSEHLRKICNNLKITLHAFRRACAIVARIIHNEQPHRFPRANRNVCGTWAPASRESDAYSQDFAVWADGLKGLGNLCVMRRMKFELLVNKPSFDWTKVTEDWIR